MAKNGQASWGKTAGYVNLTHMPTPKSEYQVNFEKLTGGLNIYAPDYRLNLNESPDMENMVWKNGTLCSRYGQSYVDDDSTRGAGYTCFEELFWDNAFYHIGNKLWYAEPGDSLTELCDLSTVYGLTYSPARGTFLRYGDDLFYKAPGVFLRIHWTGSAFTYADIAATAYTPITYVNADWRNGSGDSYQPENRLSAKKTIWFNPGLDNGSTTFSGDGSTTEFSLASIEGFYQVTDITVDGIAVGNWIVNGTTLTFYHAPVAGTNNIVVYYTYVVKTYQLPVVATSIDKVEVDGTTLASTDYSYNTSTGLLTLSAVPNHGYPLGSNTVRITYVLANPDAVKSIMDCPYAIVYGGSQNICMVVGGCTAQPNAFFWNGNNVAMDVSYWPMEQYNFGADTEDAITGFGKQQGYLVVFKNRSIGKGELKFTSLQPTSDAPARTMIEIDYTNINAKTGCDLPWSIQLIENNLVFCNTQQGVHFIADSSAAYENNIITISLKVNGDVGRIGLLRRVREAARVSSFDDTRRYWVIADDKAYCWDYTISDHKNPSWFYLTGVDAPALFMDVETLYHLNTDGRVTVFDNSYADYGGDFERRYQFATQYFRTYDRLKTVREAIFTFRPDTDFEITLEYLTDYEVRKDITDVYTHEHIECRSWRLVPRNLRWRDLNVYPFAYVSRRRPGCRHVRHFSMRLTCTGAGYDMPILSAQVFYTYEGRDR